MTRLALSSLVALLLAVPALLAEDLLIADFEGDTYGDWTVTGEAFGPGPARGTLPNQQQVSGFKGRGLVNSFFKGDRSTGTLTSPLFRIEKPWLNFLIGGGGHAKQTCMQLLVDGKIVRSATGPNTKGGGSEKLAPASWDVQEFLNQSATIAIIDQHTGGWGHINVDHIVQSDTKAASTLVALEQVLTVDNSHLIVPVANSGKKQKQLLGIFVGDTLVQNFQVSLPRADEPSWLAAYPLAHFGLQGKTIRIAPANKPTLPDTYAGAFARIKVGAAADTLAADDYEQPYRDQFHVTTRRGWNNDPNGMVYHNGTYHLYYQYNPFGTRWGNMHWGHLESTDLVHWEEKPIALYQKTVRDYMFSGGGFVDFNNSAGLGENTLFVAFTSTGRGECLAYSKDNGLTFTELPENPIVKHTGRDPKVIWYEPEKKWVLVTYSESPCEETKAVKGNRHMAFYASKDLRTWTRTGGFTDRDQGAVFECPEFFPLDYKGKTKWILLGAQNRYFIGDFDGQTFIKESGPHGSRHGAFYAAQTFSDVPDGRRIQIGWLRMKNLHLGRFPARLVSQGFTLPHEMTLVETPAGPRMAFNPVKELEALRVEELAGLDACQNETTEVVIEFEEGGRHELVINGIDASFEGQRARIFTDRTVNEVYADRGLYYEVRERRKNAFGSTETAVKNGTIKSLKVYRLKSIWAK